MKKRALQRLLWVRVERPHPALRATFTRWGKDTRSRPVRPTFSRWEKVAGGRMRAFGAHSHQAFQHAHGGVRHEHHEGI